ncbi:LolA family protein, partial [Micromonospora arborensis]|uniref:LolA family protein n=1 Tax=Micromonospora arborensis TaxID=2116518 RepID=UPI001FC9F93E
MSVLRSRPVLRWLVPATAAVAVIGGGAAIGTFAAEAEPSLPPRTAAQLLVDLQTSRLEGLSGTVVQRADLGLPSLVGLVPGNELTTLLTGTHTLRVWYSGPERQRVALLDTLGEQDVIRNGRDLWTWQSRTNTASHRTLGDAGAAKPAPEAVPNLPATPQEAADLALGAIDPSTEVSVGRSATVAGQDAYELVLSPRDQDSLVHQLRIAIDAKQHVPLRFEVLAKGSDQPAFEVAFTQVDYRRPDADQFSFNPPPGVT